jgi:hypothetical protein
MRAFLRVDQATKGLSALGNSKWRRGVILQVLGAGTVWFDADRAPLENTDSLGTPTAGNSLTSANGPFYIQDWNGDLWLRGSANGVTVEVTPLWGNRD